MALINFKYCPIEGKRYIGNYNDVMLDFYSFLNEEEIYDDYLEYIPIVGFKNSIEDVIKYELNLAKMENFDGV